MHRCVDVCENRQIDIKKDIISLFSANWVESSQIHLIEDPGSWFLQSLIPDPCICYLQTQLSQKPFLYLKHDGMGTSAVLFEIWTTGLCSKIIPPGIAVELQKPIN